MPPGERSGPSPSLPMEMTAGERPESHQEQAVLRDLRGSDSAMGITKKVRALQD